MSHMTGDKDLALSKFPRGEKMKNPMAFALMYEIKAFDFL